MVHWSIKNDAKFIKKLLGTQFFLDLTDQSSVGQYVGRKIGRGVRKLHMIQLM